MFTSIGANSAFACNSNYSTCWRCFVDASVYHARVKLKRYNPSPPRRQSACFALWAVEFPSHRLDLL